MALPFILAGAAAVGVTVDVEKDIDAKEDLDHAESVSDQEQNSDEDATSKLKQSRRETNQF